MSESYFSLNSQIENKTPLNNLTSHIPTSYIKWETRNGKLEVRSGKWEKRDGKWEIRNLEVEGGMALNWAPRNGKWDSNEDSRDWSVALRWAVLWHLGSWVHVSSPGGSKHIWYLHWVGWRPLAHKSLGYANSLKVTQAGNGKKLSNNFE